MNKIHDPYQIDSIGHVWFIVVSCDCISIKYKKLEQRIPHCCIKVTAPERNSRDYGKKHDEFLYKAN